MAEPQDANLLGDMLRDLVRAGRLWRKMASNAASSYGVSEAASSPLLAIARLGEDVRQVTLADAVGLDGASMVRLLDELQAAALITRAQDTDDRRVNVVNLTEKGKEVVAGIGELMNALRVEVFKSISRKDIETTLRICRTIEAAATGVSTK